MRNEFESGYAPGNGLKMYYEVHGVAGGDNPPLVLLHGDGDTIGTSLIDVIHAIVGYEC